MDAAAYSLLYSLSGLVRHPRQEEGWWQLYSDMHLPHTNPVCKADLESLIVSEVVGVYVRKAVEMSVAVGWLLHVVVAKGTAKDTAVGVAVRVVVGEGLVVAQEGQC
ncbi:jg4434 [Pararge aegeria aegeria]|uniref:Jg4434 protein n=1 Tax=Pararge aegeria aegeria TaxID=348720 RepID=A0A8S4QD89_9NEOP|nr:jg4434 [Pararge aegeria aegeria]